MRLNMMMVLAAFLVTAGIVQAQDAPKPVTATEGKLEAAEAARTAEELVDTRDSSSTPCPTGTISAGLTLNDGNSDTLTADIGLTAEYKPGENEWLLAAQAAYGEQSDEETVDNSKIKLNYRRLLCSPWFVFGEGSYSRDDIAAVDYRYVLSAGPGIYALKTGQVSLSFEASPAMIWEEVGGESDERFALRFAERFEWTIAEGSKLWQSCEFLPDADDWDDYLINSELGAEAPLAGRISLRLLVKHAHDSIPAEGREKNDLSVVAGLGYGF